LRLGRWPLLLRTIQLALTIGVTWFLFRVLGLSWDSARALDRGEVQVDPGGLALSFLLLFLAFLMAAGYWGRMIGALGGSAPTLGTAFRIILASTLARYIPGRIWPLAGVVLLSARAGIPSGVAATATLLTQLFSLGGAAGLALLSLRGELWTLVAAEATLWLWLGIGVLVAILVLSSSSLLIRRGAQLGARLLPDQFELATRIPRGGFGLRWTLAYLANWALYGLSFAVFVRSLGVTESSFVFLGGAYAAAYLLGYLAIFAPGGLGVREGFLVAFLQGPLGAVALAVALLARLWITSAEAAAAGVAIAWELWRGGGSAEGTRESGVRWGGGEASSGVGGRDDE